MWENSVCSLISYSCVFDTVDSRSRICGSSVLRTGLFWRLGFFLSRSENPANPLPLPQALLVSTVIVVVLVSSWSALYTIDLLFRQRKLRQKTFIHDPSVHHTKAFPGRHKFLVLVRINCDGYGHDSGRKWYRVLGPVAANHIGRLESPRRGLYERVRMLQTLLFQCEVGLPESSPPCGGLDAARLVIVLILRYGPVFSWLRGLYSNRLPKVLSIFPLPTSSPSFFYCRVAQPDFLHMVVLSRDGILHTRRLIRHLSCFLQHPVGVDQSSRISLAWKSQSS